MAKPKARTPEARENQLIAMAYDLAEKQMQDGTISATVLANFVKMGSQRERMEREKLEAENAHLRAKIETMQYMKESEGRYQEALDAFRSYSGGFNDSQDL